MQWARENAASSGLADRPIRWIVDDCKKFVQREIRRGRDVYKRQVPAASMQAAIEKAAGSILEAVKLFDVYKGKGIPEGKKSVAYSLSMRAPDRTLTDEECDEAMKQALAALEKDFGAVLRG